MMINLTDFENRLSLWKQSQNASEYCRFIDLQESIRSQLRQEDKFTTTIAGFHYTVKYYDGKWFVFRRDHAATIKKSYNHTDSRTVTEIKVFTLDEANKHLSNNQDSFELFGSDPVKIVNNEIKVVMARRIRSRKPLKERIILISDEDHMPIILKLTRIQNEADIEDPQCGQDHSHKPMCGSAIQQYDIVSRQKI